MSTAKSIAQVYEPQTGSKAGQVLSMERSMLKHQLYKMHEWASELAPGSYLMNTRMLNDQSKLDSFMLFLNDNLKTGEFYIGRADHIRGYERSEDLDTHRSFSTWKKYSRFVVHRVLPKLPITGSVYRRLSKDINKRMSRTEVLGRFKCAGFEIIQTDLSKDGLVFLMQKTGAPINDVKPSYGPLVRLNRMVKNGRMAGIYKFRTMYPYAEFIQDYVYELNKLDDGGKLKDDFRISEEGRFFRKYFIDELPMIINLIKGDIKLVGVRPLSAHYFSLYTNNMQQKRRKHKPGLLPPYYSEKTKPSTIEEIMVSEIRYLFMYERNPFRTDVKYFFRITKNILSGKLTSA